MLWQLCLPLRRNADTSSWESDGVPYPNPNSLKLGDLAHSLAPDREYRPNRRRLSAGLPGVRIYKPLSRGPVTQLSIAFTNLSSTLTPRPSANLVMKLCMQVIKTTARNGCNHENIVPQPGYDPSRTALVTSIPSPCPSRLYCPQRQAYAGWWLTARSLMGD